MVYIFIMEYYSTIKKNGSNNPVWETAKETQMYRTVFWTLLGGGVIWENGIETCIVSYEKRVASLDLMQNTVYMYHNFLIHSFANGHLGLFHVLAIVNSSEVDIKVHVSSVAQMVKRLSTMRETRV